MLLFHSSPHKIKGRFLEPRPSGVIGGESAVFAANKKFVSLMFLAKWSDLDFDFGSTGGVWFAIEHYPGAFERVFKNRSGYVYSVKKAGFADDPRLGLRGVELIRKTPVEIEKTEFVPDVWAALQQTPIVFVTFLEYMKLVRAHVKKKASRVRPKPAARKPRTPRTPRKDKKRGATTKN